MFWFYRRSTRPEHTAAFGMFDNMGNLHVQDVSTRGKEYSTFVYGVLAGAFYSSVWTAQDISKSTIVVVQGEACLRAEQVL